MTEKSDEYTCIVYEHPKNSSRFDIIGNERVVYIGKLSRDFFIPHLAEVVGIDRKRVKGNVYRFLFIGIKDNKAEIYDETFDFEELFVRGARKDEKHPHFRYTCNSFTLDESVSRAIAELFSSFKKV